MHLLLEFVDVVNTSKGLNIWLNRVTDHYEIILIYLFKVTSEDIKGKCIEWAKLSYLILRR